MVKTVNQAFRVFLDDVVNLDSEKTKTARSSRDNLISNINSFSGDGDFFVVYDEKILNFGSFARRTKIRPLDDIDIMICFSGEATRTYEMYGDEAIIYGSASDKSNNLLDQGYRLNSTKVINRLISKLSLLNDYKKAEMHKNMEAATLQLKSYEWNFDIVPCFYTVHDFYLIPNGKGSWKKTDPRIDRDRVTTLNQKFNGNLLSLIRLIKYWNIINSAKTISSYLLEAMVLDRYDKLVASESNWWIGLQFRDTMEDLSNSILKPVYDPKGIQGDINDLTNEEKVSVSNSMTDAYEKAKLAISLEFSDTEGRQRDSINKWREVFGDKFPQYE